MAAWFKLLDQQCRSCGSDTFYLCFPKLSALVYCERCGALFNERPLGPHRVIDHEEPAQLEIPVSS
jgi:ribosomal protein S27E